MLKKLGQRYLSDIKVIPPVLDRSYLPSLDGFRGFSILIVLIAHLDYTYKNKVVFFLFEGGNLGVAFFFVISGFLITTLLLKERLNTGRISLRRFYIRRFLRIFPVAYLFLFTLLLLNYFFHLYIPGLAFIGAALYLTNFSFIPFIWYTAHFWSLAVEEQYYLLFPSLLKINLRFFCIFIPVLIVLLNCIRWMALQLPDSLVLKYINEFFSNIDAVLVGSLLSILAFKDMIPWERIKRYKTWINLGFIIPIILLHKTANHFHPWVINHTLTAIMIGIMILSNIQPGTDVFYRILNSKILVRIGLLSYSIYIWQSIFTVPSELPAFRNLPWRAFPVNMICLVIVSCCSYYFYEMKFLKLKDRFKQVYKRPGLKNTDNHSHETAGSERYV